MGEHRTKWVLGAFVLAGSGMPAAAQLANLPAEVGTAIAEMGPTLGPDVVNKTMALMRPLEASRAGLSAEMDIAYGTDPLQKLDLFPPEEKAALPGPIVVFVHGGGFRRGDKRGGDNIAAYFARHRMLGVSINYRLAPAVGWPEQSLDLGAAVAWLKANAAQRGGDPRHIVVIGHSAGAAVVASYLLDHAIETAHDGVVGAVLLSGVYGYNTSAPFYYGEDPGVAAEREPRSHTGGAELPFLVVIAQYDPPRIAADGHQFAAALCTHGSKCPSFLWLGGHNHMSETGSIDTADDRLGSTIREFVKAVAK